jgi:DNA-binding response OmpR family regulator
VRLILVGVDSARLSDLLRAAGHEVRAAGSAGEAELLQRTSPFDAILAERDADRLKQRVPDMPVAVWLAAPSTAAAAEALEAGADEVVHAGMGDREIAARLAALSRHTPAGHQRAALGPLVVDRERGEATWHGRRLALTARERDVLYALTEAAGATVRREAIYRAVWGFAMARGDRSVDVNVKRLRDKLAAAIGAPVAIETEAGVGYRLVVADAAVTAL